MTTSNLQCVQNPSKRNTMEDVYRVVPEFDGDPHTSFVAVYDGHGGKGMKCFRILGGHFWTETFLLTIKRLVFSVPSKCSIH